MTSSGFGPRAPALFIVEFTGFSVKQLVKPGRVNGRIIRHLNELYFATWIDFKIPGGEVQRRETEHGGLR